MTGRRLPGLTRSVTVVRTLPAPDAVRATVPARTTRVPEPVWWREAPAAVADVLAHLPGLSPRTSLHFAVAEYCAVAGDLYQRRVEGRKYRLRPSASTELEPSRLLMAHSDALGTHHEAYFHCGGHDAASAEQAASAALADAPLGGAAVLRVSCSESRFRLTGVLMSAVP